MVKTFNISNRRYLGNKYKLLDWIKQIVNENCVDVNSFSKKGAIRSVALSNVKLPLWI